MKLRIFLAIFVFGAFASAPRAEPEALRVCQHELLVAPSEESAHELYMMGAGLYNSEHFIRIIVDELKFRGVRKREDYSQALRDAAKLLGDKSLQSFALALADRLRTSIPLNFPLHAMAQARESAASLGMSYEDFLSFLVQWRALLDSDPANTRIAQLVYYLLKEQAPILSRRVESYLAKHPVARWNFPRFGWNRPALETPSLNPHLTLTQALAYALSAKWKIRQIAEGLDLFVEEKENLTTEDLKAYLAFMNEHFVSLPKILRRPHPRMEKQLNEFKFPKSLSPEKYYGPLIEIELATLSKLLWKVSLAYPQEFFTDLIDEALDAYVNRRRSFLKRAFVGWRSSTESDALRNSFHFFCNADIAQARRELR
jgi:hypothetical protein